MSRPIIFEHNDPLVFMRHYWEFLQETTPEVTIRRWASQMGLTSPVSLVSIIQGKREMKLKDLDFIFKGLDLSLSESRYLEVLVMQKKARSLKEKSILQMLLNSLSAEKNISPPVRPADKVFECEDEELFSSWLDATLLSALQLKSGRENLDLVRKNLLWESNSVHVDKSLEKILKLGLISDNQQEPLRPQYDSVTTRDDHYHRGARAFLAQMNEIATQAIDLPLEEREFQCFSIPVRQSEVPAFKLLLRKIRSEIASFATEDGDTVYQFNLEMFPLLKPIKLTDQKVVEQLNRHFP